MKGLPHPRVYGTYPRLIGRYVLDKKVLTLEAAVSKCTSLPAKAMGLKTKGTLAPGMDADVCVFRPQDLQENATFENPRQLSTGMTHIFVNGSPAIRNSTPTATHAGTILTP